MSQLSQLSDIIKDVDVDKFIEENDITEDVKQLLNGETNEHQYSSNDIEDEDEDVKPVPSESVGMADYPPSSHYEMNFPPDQPINLRTEEYPGPHDFQIIIVPNGPRTPWEYSIKLNKIYIGINIKFPVEFSIKNRPANENLYIRTTPVFSQSQHFQEHVCRCVGHQHPGDPSNKDLPEHIYHHIIRCSNVNSRYYGDKNNGTRLNIVTPLARPQAGADTVKEFYHFVCKNSCPLGMNRRPIDVIFALENELGEVLGRRLVAVRVCSCPKRDKDKEENDFDKSQSARGKKRKAQDAKATNSRFSGLTSVDHRIFNASNISIVGKRNYLHVLEVCRDRMASEILKVQGQNGADAPFKKCYNELCSLIDKASAE